MIAPIFFILLIFLLVAVPAIVGWKLCKKHGQTIRMAGTILAGQVILTPVIIFISLSKDMATSENPVRTMIIYGCMAIAISIMTFAVMEIKKTRKDK